MASYINVFLKTEITAIPKLLDKYMGTYYNNTLCNGATWIFLFWYILHVAFDDLMNALLKKMKYKEYVRIRLKESLWYLGFYGTACLYCLATLYRNNTQFFTFKQAFDRSTPSEHLILGFIVIATFYLHSAFWERLKYCQVILASSYLCLFCLLCISYFLRYVESTFRLTILICLTQIGLELARCVTLLTKREKPKKKFVIDVFYFATMFLFVVNYLVFIPFFLGYPLLKGFIPSISILLTFLIIWLTLQIYDSVLFKTLFHWLYHQYCDKNKICEGDLYECVLFPRRNDATYNFLVLRKEIKEREEKYLSLRRPKNRNMVMQTLKCMVAIKRKLHEKRQNTNLKQMEKSITDEHITALEEKTDKLSCDEKED